jgi:hypothetical protein
MYWRRGLVPARISAATAANAAFRILFAGVSLLVFSVLPDSTGGSLARPGTGSVPGRSSIIHQEKKQFLFFFARDVSFCVILEVSIFSLRQCDQNENSLWARPQGILPVSLARSPAKKFRWRRLFGSA